MKPCAVLLGAFLVFVSRLLAAEYHVATQGDDGNPGTRAAPFRTVQRAADVAQPGDVVTIHAGTYRERVNPPRGGTGDGRRITYRAAKNAQVEIKGSEVVKGWTKVQDGVWKATLSNGFFGGFNPYTNVIRGDWFDRRGRDHHTGAVYLNGEWLTEAAKLDEVLSPPGSEPAWLRSGEGGYLLNVAWWRPGGAGTAGERIPATRVSARNGTQDAACSEGGECLGFIAAGHWVRYDRVDFGGRTDQLELRVASASDGGVIEIRLEAPDGELVGTCPVPNTGGWQSWVTHTAKVKPVKGVRTVCLVFREGAAGGAPYRSINPRLWFAQVDAQHTTLWAQFGSADPNRELVEINVRQTVFYPDQPGRDFISVRGLVLRHAATPWAPPTAEQVGLIGTHWSRGWIIENNVVSHSTCSGIALGKHGDAFDNTSADTAEGYVKTIERAHAFAIPWTRERIGHHIVRNNTISHCEQAGIVGSLGAAFSLVEGNVIHDIHVRRLFSGAEMAGIKFHAAIDTTIRGNHIYRCCRGLWLDWMAQGTRVMRNLMHDNGPSEDLFMEVNHGPFLVENNVFLSRVSLLDVSEGGAYVHNLFAGKIINHPELGRETPYHPAHSTVVAGLVKTHGGDNRFYNNVFLGAAPAPAAPTGATPQDPQWGGSYGLWVYDFREFPLFTGGNVYLRGARPYAQETDALDLGTQDPGLALRHEGGRVFLRLDRAPDWEAARTGRVTTERLGQARVSRLPYVSPAGAALVLDRDFLGKRRRGNRPTPGPLEGLGSGEVEVRLR